MKKEKSKKKHLGKKLILFALCIIIIITIVTIIIIKNNTKEENNLEKLTDLAEPEQLVEAEIDVNEEAYKGRKFYQNGDDIIIQGENDSRTISTKNSDNNEMKEVSEEDKDNYVISDVNIEEVGGRTIISGKITNNSKEKKKIIVSAKFYSDEEKIKGATNTTIEVNSGETADFTMETQDAVSQYKSNVFVEYTN